MSTYDFIKNATLTDILTNTTYTAKSLWSQQPVLFHLIRRPGCHFCREQAALLYANSNLISSRLGVVIVPVVHELVGAHEFAKKYVKGRVYIDTDKILFQGLHGGTLSYGGWLQFITPKFISNLMRRSGTCVEGNYFEGYQHGWLLGGVMVVRKKEVVWAFKELTFGDMPQLVAVLEACAAASGQLLSEKDVKEAYLTQETASTYQ